MKLEVVSQCQRMENIMSVSGVSPRRAGSAHIREDHVGGVTQFPPYNTAAERAGNYIEKKIWKEVNLKDQCELPNGNQENRQKERSPKTALQGRQQLVNA